MSVEILKEPSPHACMKARCALGNKDYLANWTMKGKEPRAEQVQIFNFCRDSGVSNHLVGAPTGVGKSPVATTVAETDSGVILTPQKILQDQYLRDWAELKLIKGKVNYTCDLADNRRAKIYDCDKGGHLCNKVRGQGNATRCPYAIAKNEFIASQVGVANYSYFFGILQQEDKIADMIPHDWLIFDEGHELESQLINSACLEITEELCEFIGTPYNPPDKHAKVAGFLNHFLSAVRICLVRLGEEIERQRSSGGNYIQRDLVMLSKLVHLEGKTSFCITDSIERGAPWVHYVTYDGFRSMPLFADGLFQRFVAPLGKKILVMSATLPPAETMAASFGWAKGDYASLDVPSPFAVENRPIYYKPVAALNYKNMEQNLPKIAKAIERILKAYPDSKGIVHCHSFKLGSSLYDLCPTLRKRGILHKPNMDRDALLENHCSSTKPTVLISPSMTEGVDLHDDLGRFAIIPKVPYPNMGDSWVKARMEADPVWFNFTVIKTIVQACGRIVRHHNDQGDCYILDGKFDDLLRRSGDLFPEWFMDALIEI